MTSVAIYPNRFDTALLQQALEQLNVPKQDIHTANVVFICNDGEYFAMKQDIKFLIRHRNKRKPIYRTLSPFIVVFWLYPYTAERELRTSNYLAKERGIIGYWNYPESVEELIQICQEVGL